ncbi:hypothetical protein ACU686_04000 [Yinghuangia aomiensis]
MAAFAWAMEHRAYDMWGALIVFPLLLTLSIPILERLTRDDDPWMQKIVVWALVAKLVACFARYWMAFVLYDGNSDAATYDLVGRHLAVAFRDGDFTPDIHRKVIGTGFIMIVTGIVYAFVGQSILAGYLVFSWMGFWGLYLCWRAFGIAYPDGDHKRYAKLVFFLPSLLFWPSGIGKDTWMLLTLGMCAYGTALLLVRRRGAYVFLLLGMTGATMVRPHITVLVMCGLIVAFLLRTRPQQVSALGPLRAGFGAVVLGAGAVVALKQVGKFFGTADLSAGAAAEVASRTQTADGAGRFGPAGGGADECDFAVAFAAVADDGALPALSFRSAQYAGVAGVARRRRTDGLGGDVAGAFAAHSGIVGETALFGVRTGLHAGFRDGIREHQELRDPHPGAGAVLPFALILLGVPKPDPPPERSPPRRKRVPAAADGVGAKAAGARGSGAPGSGAPGSGAPGSGSDGSAGAGVPAAGRGDSQWR